MLRRSTDFDFDRAARNGTDRNPNGNDEERAGDQFIAACIFIVSIIVVLLVSIHPFRCLTIIFIHSFIHL